MRGRTRHVHQLALSVSGSTNGLDRTDQWDANNSIYQVVASVKTTEGLHGSIESVTGIAEAGHDITLFVETFIKSSRHNGDVGGGISISFFESS